MSLLRVIGLTLSAVFLLIAGGWSGLTRSDAKTWTIAEWVAWRDAQIKLILTPTVDAGGRKILSREDVILRCIDSYKTLEPALGHLRNDPELDKALGNFARFVTTQVRTAYYNSDGKYTHALGFEFEDQEYWDRVSGDLKLPPLLRSREFLSGLSHPQTYGQAIDLIEAHNRNLSNERKWIVLPYRSRFLKSADTTTYGRLLVVVPAQRDTSGAPIDLWVQFAISAPGETTASNPVSVSVISVHRGVGRSTATMSDFMRQTDTTTGKINLVPTMMLTKNPSKNCYDCHKSAVLPIHPKSLIPIGTANDSIAEKLNDRIAGYGKCEMDFVAESAYGPTIGATTEPIVEGAGLSPESTKRIRDAMKCGSCHSQTSSINYPAAADTNIGFLVFEEKRGLAQTYVEKGWMPPANNLSESERKVLWKSLSKQYLDSTNMTGEFVEWLKGKELGDER